MNYHSIDDTTSNISLRTKNIHETSSIYKYCSCFSIFILIVGILGCAITYIVYVIMSLHQTSYSEQKDMCEKSNAWIYILLTIIINVIVGSCIAISNNYDNSNKPYGNYLGLC